MELSNIGKDINLECNNGDIIFSNETVLGGNLHMENEFGLITLKVPKEQEGHFRIETNFGNIEQELNLKVNEKDTKKYIEETIGKGNIKVEIVNHNGDIKLLGR